MKRSVKIQNNPLFRTPYLFSVVFLSTFSAFAEDWPQFRGPNQNGISSETGWNTDWASSEPTIAWRARLGAGYSSFSVSDGKVYTMGHVDGTDVLYCFDAKTGDEVWRYEYNAEIRDKQHEGGPASTPSIDGDKVYTASRDGRLFCLNKNNGTVIWEKNMTEAVNAKIPTWAFAGSPIVWNQYVVIDVGRTVAMDKETGDIVWKSEDYGSAYSTPVPMDLNGRAAFASFPEFGLVILDAKDGSEICRHEWETNYGVNATMPLVIGNKVFISSGYNRGCALIEIADGSANVLWENTNMRNHMNPCVLYEGYLYGFDDKDLACLDLKTGETKWSEGGLGKGSLILSDGKLICLSDRGELVLVKADPSGYNEISRTQVLGGKNLWTQPVLSGGMIYARNNAKGDAVAVNVSPS
ncbi:MAG: PQQ-like beta-propeller repeat protein [Candidatus Omnitrophica bacterium]|nr:PQQ-like beta-propeller repeat protein [Candidatus Omnitrophota bacterium]MCB9782660.1 PQQ-like beta-propeller repeat protein [Candidatus Omnitrophota bacterium]